jgi:hypothetical protein
LQAHCWAASNLSLRPSQPTRQLSGSPPGPRQPPFGVGHEALSTGLCLPLAFRRVAFASWAFLFPLRIWAFLPKIVRLTGPRARPHRGCHVPHQLRRGGRGCLLYCVAWVPRRAAVKAADLCQTGNAVWFLAGSSSRQPSVATTLRFAASTEVHWHSPIPSFPGPVRLDGSGSPWASPVCCRTPRCRGACVGREPTWALVGAVVTHHRPLIWSDFVSHVG